MNKLHLILAAAIGSFALAAAAQDTNALKTQIGVFEARTGVVIVKGWGQTGSLAAGPAEIFVRCKETSDVSTGQKVYGLAVEIEGNSFTRERILIDDDEIDSLLNGLDYLIKINYDVTTLPSFEASYTTKAGLRLIASSVRREGAVQSFLQYGEQLRIPLSSVQMTQFYGLLEQAAKNLAALKTAK
jgi:hypothetical protein